MTKLYQDDVLYDKKVISKKGHKLQSLLNRTESCCNVTYEAFLLPKTKKSTQNSIPSRKSQQHLTQHEKATTALRELNKDDFDKSSQGLQSLQEDEEEDDYFSLN